MCWIYAGDTKETGIAHLSHPQCVRFPLTSCFSSVLHATSVTVLCSYRYLRALSLRPVACSLHASPPLCQTCGEWHSTNALLLLVVAETADNWQLMWLRYNGSKSLEKQRLNTIIREHRNTNDGDAEMTRATRFCCSETHIRRMCTCSTRVQRSLWPTKAS